jgi:hypothetical protein
MERRRVSKPLFSVSNITMTTMETHMTRNSRLLTFACIAGLMTIASAQSAWALASAVADLCAVTGGVPGDICVNFKCEQGGTACTPPQNHQNCYSSGVLSGCCTCGSTGINAKKWVCTDGAPASGQC